MNENDSRIPLATRLQELPRRKTVSNKNRHRHHPPISTAPHTPCLDPTQLPSTHLPLGSRVLPRSLEPPIATVAAAAQSYFHPTFGNGPAFAGEFIGTTILCYGDALSLPPHVSRT